MKNLFHYQPDIESCIYWIVLISVQVNSQNNFSDLLNCCPCLLGNVFAVDMHTEH